MPDAVDAIGALHDPVRRAVYHHVVGQPEAVGRHEVAQALDIGRTLAAFHLDKLAAAKLLAAAVERAGADAALQAAAREHGESVGRASKGAASPAVLLAGLGYEPQTEGRVTRLRNCPFHALASEYPPLICGMNLAVVEGLLAGAGLAGCTARLDPSPDGCCVAIESKNKKR